MRAGSPTLPAVFYALKKLEDSQPVVGEWLRWFIFTHKLSRMAVFLSMEWLLMSILTYLLTCFSKNTQCFSENTQCLSEKILMLFFREKGLGIEVVGFQAITEKA